MSLSEKARIYYRVWCCAYQRRYIYRGTPRVEREHETILACLNMKDAQWMTYDTDKRKF